MEISSLYKIYLEHPLVDTDTRKISKNSIFFALKGDNFNGNKFAEQALKLGASYAIVDEKEYKTHKNIILVDNVLSTLQKLANYHRKQLNIPVIALTGSNGKTTTKELINCVLSKKFNTLATNGNFNNHIGVPLTLLRITKNHEIAIIEMGANHQKEIEFLSSICEPDFGYITNFGKAHLEGFGGVEGVIKGKSELYTFLKENDKTAFVNPDDKIQIDKTKNIKTIFFNLEKLSLLEVNPFVKLSYKNEEIQSQLIGKYNYSNIIAAITIGNHFDVSTNDIKSAIESYIPKNNRSQIIKTEHNKIILDAYNANPSSMKVALESFALLKEKPKAIILGDMFELGNDSIQEHKNIIDLATSLTFDKCFFVGENFLKTESNINLYKTFEELKESLEKDSLYNYSILVKGSRGMQLERLLEVIN
ncbi:UDP-N-acetylmuramoyl-tripeptide--D-alanyl-D-alanine ligase [Polaribacter porphyrae]|uniref:UDP-N-acetylmuramoyl-tripeptide--D-alanyl-D-alanine ligase n=1 Tax=Polaribacter porphyrae TaxID=1137780 RepID=A0A2S7WKF8_9FLAO|nr:UDP-N-acetylmuramoyl-tripeptide--D-alanyl-D-alanine ligase [Polaribacter porphyrae]PQJ77782.1 UDP-N-acetylmuramoyl-tripeptide--D-alanyl-D-alanine ligase [Polaribacter porphyrae]